MLVSCTLQIILEQQRLTNMQGPNTTTFLVSRHITKKNVFAFNNLQIPAEAFPTRYRCTCHGISAASGKLGSVLGQVVITKLVDSDSDPKSKRVGYLLIS